MPKRKGCSATLTSAALDFYIAAHIVADLRQIALHALGILLVDDFEQFLQLRTNLRDLIVGIGVEEDFLQQVVILVEHALGNAHVTLEGGARRVLMLHDGSKDEGGDEGDGERVGHRLVVLLEGVLIDVESQPLVEVLEEDAPHVVTLADDDGILLGELLKVGKRGAEHRVGADIAHTRRLVELLHICLHRGDVADDALLREIGNHLAEYRDCILQGDGIDKQLGLEPTHLVETGKALAVVGEPHPLGVALKDCHLMIKTQQVDEEASHLACAHD